MPGHTGMHCLALSQHGKNVLGLNLSDNWALPVWSLHVLIMPGLVFPGASVSSHSPQTYSFGQCVCEGFFF